MIAANDRLPFALRGKADLVLVDGLAKQHKEILAGLQMVIMVRKDLQPQHESQMVGQLISVGLKAPEYSAPMAMLTDLSNQWHFFWFENPDCLYHLDYTWPKNAMAFVKCALPLSADDAFKVPNFDEYVRVASLAQVLDPDSEY